MPIAGPSYTVTDKTSLRDLDAFLKTQAEGKAVILGKRDASGAITLYTGRKSESKLSQFVDRMLGRPAKRQELAAAAIKDVFSRLQLSTAGRLGTGTTSMAASEKLFAHIGDVIDRKTEGGVRSFDVRDLTRAALAITRQLPSMATTAANVPKGPGLPGGGPDGPAPVPAPIGRLLATALAKGAETGSIAVRYGDQLGQQLRQAATGGDARLALALSTGAAMKAEIVAGLKTALAAMAPPATMADRELQTFANLTVDRALSQVMDDQAVDGTSTSVPMPGTSVELPNIRLGGIEYRPTAFLGTGGFANVFEYASVADPADKVAFKLMKDETGVDRASGKAHADLAAEISGHKGAYGTTPCAQMIAYDGAVRLPDGRLGIVVELAPNGDAFLMGQMALDAIDTAQQPAPGKISAEDAKIIQLTMLRDMALGLQHMHSASNSTHFDFKSVNCFIGQDGTAKIGDFGLTIGATDAALADVGRVDSVQYKAPELLRVERDFDRIETEGNNTFAAENDPLKRSLKKLIPSASNAVIQELSKTILTDRHTEIFDTVKADQSVLFFDSKVDIWGLGSSAVDMLTGDPLAFDDRWDDDRAERLLAFGNNRDGEALGDVDASGRLAPGTLARRTGDKDVDALMSSMLRADPRDRASAADLLKMPALTRAGVGSAEAKRLIVALKSGDADAIDAARLALNATL